jgi:predicted RNA-binding Zn ribbon-like protein
MPVKVRDVTEVEGLPDWELVFRFSSGRLCLAFCATVGERWRRSFERLNTPEDLSRWLVQAGLADTPVQVSPETLRGARKLREAIYRLVRAAMMKEPGQEDDRNIVNLYARRSPVAAQIGPDGSRQRWAGGDAARAGLASIAADTVDLLTGNAIHRVRECDAPDCALLFLDTSRPGRRRWCADGACGSKARSAAYRARRTSA